MTNLICKLFGGLLWNVVSCILATTYSLSNCLLRDTLCSYLTHYPFRENLLKIFIYLQAFMYVMYTLSYWIWDPLCWCLHTGNLIRHILWEILWRFVTIDFLGIAYLPYCFKRITFCRWLNVTNLLYYSFRRTLCKNPIFYSIRTCSNSKYGSSKFRSLGILFWCYRNANVVYYSYWKTLEWIFIIWKVFSFILTA